MNKALLVLEDGAVFNGISIATKGVAIGPLFFDTRVVGYQEVITDPANAGKILMFTYPLIGNYGVNEKFNESAQAWVKAIVIKEKSRIYSNWQARGSLADFLQKERLPAIAEIDTRTLAVHLREKGELWAAVCTNGKTREELLKEIKKIKQKPVISMIKEISTKKFRIIKGKGDARIGILDLGVTKSLLAQFNHLGARIVIFPYHTSSEQILKSKVKGLVISSGPEDDSALEEIIPTIKELIGKIPILGIALGGQLIARALGAKVQKMHLGHHGVNYPVKFPHLFSHSASKKSCPRSLETGKGEITVQNHSWVVELESLKKIRDIQITALHLNDHTVEGFTSKKYKIIAVQYYPVIPGLAQVNTLLNHFLQLMKGKS